MASLGTIIYKYFMPAIFMFTLVYWVVAILIGWLIAWKITDFKWFLLWMFCALVLYMVIVWLFPPGYAKEGMELKVGEPTDSTWPAKYKEAFRIRDSMTFSNGGGDFQIIPVDEVELGILHKTLPLKAGHSMVNGDTIPGWGPDIRDLKDTIPEDREIFICLTLTQLAALIREGEEEPQNGIVEVMEKLSRMDRKLDSLMKRKGLELFVDTTQTIILDHNVEN